MRARVFIGLGANLGDAAATLRAALDALAAQPELIGVRGSSLYRTPAWGREDQPDFINAVATCTTTLAPAALLARLLDIERGFGRERSADARWGPRTLDLDLLLYGDASITLPELTVPHPYLHARAFVLVPLLELEPDAVIPGVGSAAAALARVDRGGIEALR
ncbi:2-amino-4-hydroxy-6-hydroxymethyldihydropteridine diphosphokinase [Luteimonas sp BLCC-B24]|uniref:2-amino-4-hydroxy-6- hydroxymethyldihydropteridine diphosphokinase n=1 Tax=Luteimonas sp. BLCC-B24 TaxID=3025317 RepID=UPI00234D34BA|nr:2-amino-4-hydroxy-6-hydroxymethyldihydropteridine diphosphokinase [Luteimonas sp. BLCC-B24]MDC7805790.1 2-amino-4-hydroxy-6-hydroxymethyldihydropteridine diphosphokinase [Luteimonas sp. BLCC-B24]